MIADFLVKLLTILALFGGISSTANPTPPFPATELPAASVTAAASPDTALGTALAFAPAGSGQIHFTNWAAIKEQHGADALTSESPFDERLDFLLGLDSTDAPASGFTLPYFAQQAKAWGWDTTDLDWEATIQGEGPPAFVLRLRDDFDFNGLIARFEERGFTWTEQDGALVYSHPLDLTVDWRTELGVFNAAVLPEAKILIHASSPDAITPLVAAYSGGANWQQQPVPQAMAAALGDTNAAILMVGPQVCSDLSSAAVLDRLLGDPNISAEQVDALKQEFFGDGTLHPYLGLGVGYRPSGSHPLGKIVLHYPTASAAEEDLAPRQKLAAEGHSLVTQAPVSERIFGLESASVAGSDLLLQVRPADDRPRRLFDMVYMRDMPFAGCP